MRIRQICAMLLSLAILLTVLSGCGNGENQQSSESPSSEPAESVSKKETSEEDTSASATGTVNRFGWEVPDEPIVLNILDAYGNYAPTEGEAAGLQNNIDYLKENFNIEMAVEHVTGDGNEALNLALAADNYPDIITNVKRDYVQRFVEQNRAVELTPYMDTIAADIKDSMGEMYPLFLDSNEKLWYFPEGMGALYELPDYSAHIRYDEWLEIGSPEIKTPEDYYNALNAIYELHPTTENGESRYVMSLYTADTYDIVTSWLTGYWGLKKGFKVDDDNQFTYWTFTEEGKEMSRFFNQFHLDGTLDPEAFVMTHEEWRAKFSSERIIGAMGGWWIAYNAGHEIWNEIDPNTPEEKRYIQVSFKYPDAEAAYITPKSEVPTYNTIITDKATDIEGIVKFANFQATELGCALTGWGIPNGVEVGDTGRTTAVWEIDEEGNWQILPESKEALINESWSYQDASHAEGMPQLFSNNSRWADGEHCIFPNQMWYDENKWKTIMMENMEGTIFNATPMILLEKDENTIIIETAIREATQMLWPNVVQSNSEEEFEAAWSALQSALESAGIHEYEEIMADNYASNLERLG